MSSVSDDSSGASPNGRGGPEGRRQSTQADVARLAGVSVATVSYVVSGRSNRKSPATAETIARVQDAMKQLDYVPARAGRVLARRRTDLVAVAVYSIQVPWVVDLVNRVEKVAADHDLGVIILRHGHMPGASDRVEALLTDGVADAAVIIGEEFGGDRVARIAKRIPVTAIGWNYEPDGFDVVDQIEAPAIREAAEYLIARGSRRPAFLGDVVGSSRRKIFAEAIRALGRPEPESVDVEDNQFAPFFDARPAAAALLARPADERPDAIMTHSDRAAIATIWAAVGAGLRVPEDLMVIGAGNITEGRAFDPALTTVGMRADDYDEVIEGLLRRIDVDEGPGRRHEMHWKLIRRASA